jgi:membrane protein YdbS with pleckstrin-like domain
MDNNKNNGLDKGILAIIVIICLIISAIDFALYYYMGAKVASSITCVAFFIVLFITYTIKIIKEKKDNDK